MDEANRIEELAVETVRAEMEAKAADGDFLTSVEAREIAESVAISEYGRMGFRLDEALDPVLGMFATIRALLVGQHRDETRQSIVAAMRALQTATGHEQPQFTDDILSFEDAPSAELTRRLLSHVLRPRAGLKFGGRGIADSERKRVLREIERLSQILLMSISGEIELT